MDTRWGSLARYRDWISVVIIAFSSLLLHLIPFLRYGGNPLGYDTGFYRRYLIQPVHSFPNTPVPGLGSDALVPRILLDTLRLTHLSPDVILYGTYLLFFAFFPVCMYFLLRPRFGAGAAFLSAFLIVLSPIQYNAFSYMFWKNAWALCLLAIAFISVERRYAVALILCDLAIALSHKTTAIIYIATLLVLAVFDGGRQRMALTNVGITGALLALVNFSVLGTALSAPPVAIFIDWHIFLVLSCPFALFIAAGWRSFLDRPRIPTVLLAFLVASLLFPIFQSPFYERIFVFCDIALAVFAGYALNHVLSNFDLNSLDIRFFVSFAALCISVGLLFGVLLDQIRAFAPLISKNSIASIEQLTAQIPPDATILTTSDEAPWFEGWTEAHIAAPGMLRDNHNLDEWIGFWTATSSAQKIAFLNGLPRPLYIATLGNFDDILGTTTIPCLTEISPQLRRDDCATKE